MMAQIKILLVDDQELVRIGFRYILEKQPDIKIIAEASSGEQALKLVREKKPDVVLMDIKMPGIGGLATIERLMRSARAPKIIALTSYSEGVYPERIVNKDIIAGFLTKECAPNELVEAIHKVYQGELYIGSKIAQQMTLRRMTIRQGNLTEEEAILKELAPREFEVLSLIIHGLSVKDVAKKLNIIPKTVNTYRYRLYKKLHVKNDVQLVHFAIRHNVLELDLITH